MTTTTRKTSKKTAAALFTPEELQIIHSAARSVWDYIGYDCLLATAEEHGKQVEQITVPRSLVLELVCDAGRLDDALQRKHAELAKRWDAIDYNTMKALLLPAFSYTRYGL